MHELGIATSIMEAVTRESTARGGARILAVGVRIGELAGVDPESLTFGWEAIVSDTPMAHLQLKIEHVPWRQRCEECDYDFEVVAYETRCSRCSNSNTRLVSGNELDIAYLDIDDQEGARR